MVGAYRSNLRPDPRGNYSPFPNVIWGLGLSPGAIATYGYLLFRENRKTYRCYPSFEEIGNAIGRSKRSVPEYVAELVEKRLIEVENTTLTLADGAKSNGTLEYHLLNPQIAVKHYNDNYAARAVKVPKPKKPRKKRELLPEVVEEDEVAPTPEAENIATSENTREWWEEDEDENELPF